MTMEKHDHELENFLREFAPSQPRALPDLAAASPWNWQRFAAAAVLTLACGGALWFSQSRHDPGADRTSRQPLTQNSVASPGDLVMSTVYLQRLALEDPAQFEAALAAASQNTLPRFDGPNSSLCVLAKD
jgi:hypothetical protein